MPAQTTQPDAPLQPAPSQLGVLADMPGQDKVDRAVSPALGEKWHNAKAGLQFRPPKGMREAHRELGESEIVEFTGDKGWLLKVAQTTWTNPLPLKSYRDNMGNEKPGVLQMTLSQLQQETPGAQVLRQDIVNIGQADVGLITVRYTIGTSRKLTSLRWSRPPATPSTTSSTSRRPAPTSPTARPPSRPMRPPTRMIPASGRRSRRSPPCSIRSSSSTAMPFAPSRTGGC